MDRGQQTAQRRWDQHRAKTRLNLRLSPQTRASLIAAAHEHQIPACEVAERLIRAGLQQGTQQLVEPGILPLLAEAVRAALEDHDCQAEDRLARLLVRVTVASDTTRRLLFTYLARQWGAEATRQVLDSAHLASVDALRKRGWTALRLDGEEAEV